MDTGAALDAGDGWPSLGALMLANGDTLVMATDAPTPGSAIVAEFRSPCALNPSFGKDGVIRLTNPEVKVFLSDLVPTGDGDVLIADTADRSRGPVGVSKLTTDGRIDQAFGTRGWAASPWSAEAVLAFDTRSWC
jgi:hypothetical protein